MRVSSAVVAVLFGVLTAGVAVAAPKSPAATTLSRLKVHGEKNRAEVLIAGAFAVPTYSVRSLDDGQKVIVEVENAVLAEDGLDVDGTAALVVRATASTTAKGVRVVLKLTRSATYRARADQTGIRVSFDAEGGDVDAREAGSSGSPTVHHAIIERRNGRERVVTELSRVTGFRDLTGRTGPARLEIKGATLGEDVARRMHGDPEGSIREVSLIQEPGRVVIEVERPEGVNATAIREGKRIVWLFSEPGSAKKGVVGSRTVAREEAIEVEDSEVAAFLSDVPMQLGASRSKRGYKGRRIDLDFKDADIHNILRLLSEVGNVNIVTADDVQGSVTIKMKNVPWDQALDVILTAKGLGMVRRGNLIRVAPQTVLEKEREMAIARKKQQVELAPLETRLIPVSYAGAGELSGRVSELLSDRGKVSTDARTNILVVRDVRENLDDVEELVRSLDSQTPQVLIEARIVEATTAFTHDVGIQWGGSVVMSSATGNPTGLVFPHDLSIAGGATDGSSPTAGLSPFAATVANPNFVVNFPAPAGTGQGGAIGLTLGSLSGNFNVALRLSAFETTGNVRIISSPRILTLDNHGATISQGTSIPYSQVSAQGVQTAFQEARLSLSVTPQVTPDGAVSMDVSITRDEPDFNQTSARGDPTILKRQAQTKLLVQDGHTAVIGGIYTRNTGRGLDQVPFFGDIPILGILFRHEQTRDGRGELLIFLTPRIVNRSEAFLKQ